MFYCAGTVKEVQHSTHIYLYTVLPLSVTELGDMELCSTYSDSVEAGWGRKRCINGDRKQVFASENLQPLNLQYVFP